MVATRTIVFYTILLFILVGVVGAVVIAIIRFLQRQSGPSSDDPPISLFKETLNFYNGITIGGDPKDIYLIFKRGTATDMHNLTFGWTQVPDAPTGTYYIPAPSNMPVYQKVPYGRTVDISVNPGGYASLKFYARINCADQSSDPSFLCERGDVEYIPGLDPHQARTPPYKPSINTGFEVTFNCAFKDTTLCHVNPSCITSPTLCTADVPGHGNVNFLYYVKTINSAQNPLVDSDGFLRANGGTGDKILLYPGFFLTGNNDFIDVSFLDGYTHSVDVYALRPAEYSQTPGVFCFVNDEATKLDIGTASLGPHLIIKTSHTNLDNYLNCPSNENIFPPPRTLLPPAGSATAVDTFRVDPQGSMPVADPNGYGQPSQALVYSSTVFNSAVMTQGSLLDLKVFRSNQEIAALPAYLQIKEQYIGCAGPCKALTIAPGTANSNITPQSPVPYGYSWAKTGFLNVGQTASGVTQGVDEVCCETNNLSTGNTFLKCNTSKYWQVSNSTNNISGNTGFGYYIFNFAPSIGDMSKTDHNPYLASANFGSEFVRAVNLGKLSNDLSVPRAYAWPHDDQYKTVQCKISDPANIGEDGAYKNYKFLIALGKY